MTIEMHGRKEIPSLNSSDDEWRTFWNSCSIGELVSCLEKLTQMERKKRPIENKSLYIRALECKGALSKTFDEIMEKNDKLIEDLEQGRS